MDSQNLPEVTGRRKQLKNMLFKGSGKLTYSPKTHLKDSSRWLILACDEGITQYYRGLYHQEFFYRPKLTRPVWGAHISVLRGEKVSNAQAWGFAANKFINFEYEPGIKDNGEYLWLKVYCDELLALRELFGVKREPQFGLHLTIGRFQNGDV